MDYSQVKLSIRNIAQEVIEAEISDTADLFESGLDSLGIIRLLIAIEDGLKVYIAITEIERETFSTIDQITDYVWERLQNNETV